MSAGLPINSRYRRTAKTQYKGKNTISVWSGASWLESAPSEVIVATSANAGRLDLIAYRYLGSPDLWWAILYYNKQNDMNWPRAGDEVAIPPVGEVLAS